MQTIRIGLLLGIRQIQRASYWTTGLIIFVMMLTFLNLVAVSGILVGLIAGSEKAVQEKSIGDIIITPLDDETDIIQTETFKRTLATIPDIAQVSVRYKAGSQVAANLATRRDLSIDPNEVSAQAVGIDPIAENAATGLAENIVEGSYLQAGESGSVLLGALTLERYTAGFADITGSLKDVYPGDTVRLTINGASRDMIVKGVVDAKAGDVASNVYLPEQELRRLSGTNSRNAQEIVIRLKEYSPETALAVQSTLFSQGLDNYAKIRTFDQALPKFITDIKQTFNILGSFVGAVGLVVASITIFIIIFINALSRRQQIGILKGIGIEQSAIEIAYIFQAALYAIIGSLLGLLITYGFLVGYFDRNPIDFPFSDGILVAPFFETMTRFGVLLGITLLAGYVPAWLIARQNTLNSILGRK